MAKTKRTKELEQLLKHKFDSRNDFFVFECALGWYGSEIVDCVKYNCQREVSCYEIKQSKSDFHSKAKLSFFGNKNYYVMPYDLYQEVEKEIPHEIGVYVAIDHIENKEKEEVINQYSTRRKTYWAEPVNGLKELYCIKSAKKVDLKADKEVILSSMLRCMQRDLNRGRRFEYERMENDIK